VIAGLPVAGVVALVELCLARDRMIDPAFVVELLKAG
jgi:hypothetical protein